MILAILLLTIFWRGNQIIDEHLYSVVPFVMLQTAQQLQTKFIHQSIVIQLLFNCYLLFKCYSIVIQMSIQMLFKCYSIVIQMSTNFPYRITHNSPRNILVICSSNVIRLKCKCAPVCRSNVIPSVIQMSTNYRVHFLPFYVWSARAPVCRSNAPIW